MLLLGFILALGTTLGMVKPGLTSPDSLNLVRVDVDPGGDLSDLAAMNLQVYTQLYTQEGKLALLLITNPEQQAKLKNLGYAPVVLSDDISKSSFYLLYALPEQLEQVANDLPLLIQEGRQAVAALGAAEYLQLENLGVEIMPLHPQPLVIPRMAMQAAPSLPDAIQPDPLIQAMVNQISASVLANSVGGLSGEWPVNINGSPYTLATRYSYAYTPIEKATRYAYERFTALGLPAGYHYYNLPGAAEQRRNVYAVQTGVRQPNREFLLVAHLDSYSPQNPYSQAPGADDNASGSAAVMAIADVLDQYLFDCTLRYVLFTGEEQGMYGSQAFAQALAGVPGIHVEAVLNLDMLAYNTQNSPASMELHVRSGNAADMQIANLFKDANTAYGLGLTPVIIQPGRTFSDHSSFWNLSIPAILAIEDWTDHTPYYHSANDQLESLNTAYYTQFTKAALATFAHMGCLLDEGILRGNVTDAASGAGISGASVNAELDATHVWTTNTLPDGSFELIVPPGSYSVDVTGSSFMTWSLFGVSVPRAQETNLDIELSSCKGAVNFSSIPFLPSVGQQVTFSATASGFPPAAYQWDFGDGSLGNGQIVTHAYATSGFYTVSLAIADLCPNFVTSRSIPVQLNGLFFPLAPVPSR